MSVWRTVATSCRATLLARAQVNPLIASLHALFTNSLLRLFDVSDPIDVNAYFCCHAASIQFAGGYPRAAAERWYDHPARLRAHLTSKPVFLIYWQTAKLESRRYKTTDRHWWDS